MDCCNSETNMNLPYSYDDDEKPLVDKSLAKIVKISGCGDSQTSADYYDIESRSYQGALTNSFLKAFSYNIDESIGNNYIDTRDYLEKENFSQIPRLTCSDTDLFDFNLY